MSLELSELKQFVADLKNDRVAQKEKEKRETWTKYVSLTMVGLAVLTAIATMKGGGFTTRTLKEMNEATFNQANASDQWAYFQAKSIKQNLYEIEVDRLKVATPVNKEMLAKAQSNIQKYEKDKKDITDEARKFEAARDSASKRATAAAELSKDMGLAITLFQISIAIGGICLVMRKKPLWFVSMAMGLIAGVQMALVLNRPL